MSFEDINIENINHCPELEFNSGLKTRLYFAPAAYFLSTPTPIPVESFESEITIADHILMKEEKILKHVDILVEENELKQTLNGAKQKKRSVTNLSVFILGFTPSVIGFIQRLKNVPLIFFIEDANGNHWQIGHSITRAFIDTAEITSGKKYEDNSGAAVTISCNSSVLLYSNSLEYLYRFGDFNIDFNTDFFI